jgi:hypothetical protein
MIVFGAWAQNATSSPSSRFGYGELNDNLPGAYRAMGGVGTGMRSNKSINSAQPASYTACDSLTFMFDIAGSFLYTNYGDDHGRRNRVNGNLEYITMQFPLWRRYVAMSLGMTPYSAVGYNFAITQNESYKYTKTYNGEGGFSQLYGGLSVNIFDWVALGTNVYYMFGETTQKRTLSFEQANLLSVQQDDNLRVNSLRLRYGAQVFHTFGQHTMVLGGIFESKQRFTKCEYKQIEVTTSDTVNTIGIGFEMPMTYAVGLSYGYANRLIIGLDYQCQDWSNVLYFNQKNQELKTRYRYAFGAEYRHNPNSRKFVDRMYWRIGANYATSYTEDSEGSVAITLGFGFPLRTIGTVVNTSFEYGKRGFSSEGLQENYLRFVVNAAIAEHWFFKRKL